MKPEDSPFNVKGGRCEACRGEGYMEIEMQFLPDVTVPCEVCKGKRYNREASKSSFKDKNIAEVPRYDRLKNRGSFFKNFPPSNASWKHSRCRPRYIRLGQPAPTLSGAKPSASNSATELAKRSTGKTYTSSITTTGLSFDDCSGFAPCPAASGGCR